MCLLLETSARRITYFFNKMPSLNYDIIIAASEGRLEDVIRLYPHCNEHVFLADAVYEACLNKHSHVVEWFQTNSVDLNKKCLFSPLPAWSYDGELDLLKSSIRVYDVNSYVNHTRPLPGVIEPNSYTPLTAACNRGYDEIVRYLLNMNDINVNLQDNLGLTPLGTACENNRFEIVKILTQRQDIDVNGLSKGSTPLVVAIDKGFNDISEHLLKQNNINVNLQDNCGLTPLGAACENNRFEIVKILTQKQDIDVNGLSKGRTPLVVAIDKGFNDISEHLLKQNNINVNLQDNCGLTPLGAACENNRFEIVKILTQKQDIDVNGLSKGITPLVMAAKRGYNGMVEHLLKHDNIQVNLRDGNGETPLATQRQDIDVNGLSKGSSRFLVAIDKGFNDISEHLLKQNNINVNLKDYLGVTPLGAACENNRFEIVKILTQKQDIDVNGLSKGRTPLVVAIDKGFNDISEHLLKQNNINVNLQDNCGLTPLGAACENNRFEIVKILTQKQDIDVNGLSKGITPLVMAAKRGYNGMVEHLLKHDNIQVNLRDGNGETPLATQRQDIDVNGLSKGSSRFLVAIDKGFNDISEHLLKQNNINVNLKDYLGVTPLGAACENNRFEIVKILTQKQDIDVNALSKGITPLVMAAKRGYNGMVEHLLKHDNIQVNLRDGNGETPLAAACKTGNILVVKLLIQLKDIDVNNSSEEGSPLILACANNHIHIASLLLMEHENIEGNLLNIPYNDGNTPLHYVIWLNRERTVLHRDLHSRPNDRFNNYSYYGQHRDHLHNRPNDRFNNYSYYGQLVFYQSNSHLINSQDNEGNTPLHLACMLKHEKSSKKIIRALLSYGADVNITNNKRETPLHVVQKNNPKLQKLLNLVSSQNILQTEIWFQRLKIFCLVVLSVCLLNQSDY